MPRPKPVTETQTAPDAPLVPAGPTLASPRATRLMRQRRDLAKSMADLKEQAEVLDAKLLALLKAEAVPDAEGKQRLWASGIGKLLLFKGKHTQINAAKLLGLGVTPSVIKKATVETPFEYPRLYPEGVAESEPS